MKDSFDSRLIRLLAMALALAAFETAAEAPEASTQTGPRAEADNTRHDHHQQKGHAAPVASEERVPAPVEPAHDHRDMKSLPAGGAGAMMPEDGGDEGGHHHQKTHK